MTCHAQLARIIGRAVVDTGATLPKDSYDNLTPLLVPFECLGYNAAPVRAPAFQARQCRLRRR